MTIENFTAVVQSVERMKLLTLLTTADIKAVGPGVWNGWKAQLIRSLYYETEPVLTGGFSEVNRAQRVAMAQAEFKAELKDWTPQEIDAYVGLHYPAYWLKVDLPQKIAHARFVRAAHAAGKSLATTVSFPAARGVTELTVLAPDHPWLLSTLAGACAVAGANIVDAQIFTTTDGRALDTIAVSREFEQDEDEARRAARITDSIEKALRGDLRLPDVVAKRAAKSRIKAFAVEPDVTINNQWSNRYTMVEVTGLDRPGLLFELTATLSKLNLNIASAHVATFGERAVDVFYVTDLFGAKITSATRQATIKRALMGLLSPSPAAAAKPARSAAAG
jgi:[protein-PII] uridylyltransferase